MAQKSSYSLPAQTFFCLTDTYCVFLDLRRDLYLSIERSRMEAVSSRLRGWPCELTTASDQSLARSGEVTRILEELVTNELLVESSTGSKDCRPTRLPLVTTTIFDRNRTSAFGSCIRHVLPIFIAATQSARSLKTKTIEETVRRVLQRKTACSGDTDDFDLGLATELVTAFNTVRHAFPRNYLCLFDSLALLDCFARYRLFPDWVFAVQAEPFEAHCWLQYRDVLINDSVERVRNYIPIMSI